MERMMLLKATGSDLMVRFFVTRIADVLNLDLSRSDATDLKPHIVVALCSTAILVVMALVLGVTTGFLPYAPAASTAGSLTPLLALPIAWFIHKKGMKRLAAMIAAFGLSTVVAIAGSTLSYEAHAVALPLADARLLTVDRAAGIDWMTLAIFLNDRSMPLHIIHFFYSQLVPMMIAGVAGASLFRPVDAIYRLVSIFAVATAGGMALATLYPAVGMIAWLDPGPLTHFNFVPAETTRSVVHLLREHRFAEIDFDAPTIGMTSFPSFHTVCGCLAIFGTWRTVLGWPTLASAAILIAGTLPFGLHYASDTMAGVVLFLLAFALVHGFEHSIRGMMHRLPRSHFEDFPGVVRCGASAQTSECEVLIRATSIIS